MGGFKKRKNEKECEMAGYDLHYYFMGMLN